MKNHHKTGVMTEKDSANAGRNLTGDEIQMLLRHFGRIEQETDFQAATVPTAITSIAYIGSYEIPLIVLLRLWKEEDKGWIIYCPHCGGTAAIHGYGGSPLSGSGSGWGTCLDCGKEVKTRFNGSAAMDAMKLVREFIAQQGGWVDVKDGVKTPLTAPKKKKSVFDVLDVLSKYDCR